MNPLDPGRLAAACSGHHLIGRQIQVLEETTSTNDVCQSAAADEAQEGLVVFAESQQAGRGQRGSVWTAPPRSSLLFSILLFPPSELATPQFLTAWSALALTEILNEQYDLDVRIKWPNDLILGGRKLCGILVEKGRGTVVGIGLNVSIEPTSFPSELKMPATSLAVATGREIDRTKLAGQLLAHLDATYHDALLSGPADIWKRWQDRAEDLLQRQVIAFTRRDEVRGTLLEIHPSRGARVARTDGTIANIPSEELLRVQRR